jgi:predicted DNA-binding transcriptional regulator AlpA
MEAEQDFVNINEIASRLGLEPAEIRVWRESRFRDEFPEPAKYESGTPYWDFEDIKDWLTKRGDVYREEREK